MNRPADYRERTYRKRVGSKSLVPFQVSVKETDLYLAATRDLSAEAQASIQRHRQQLEAYIRKHPAFADTLRPWPDDILAPPVVRDMIEAGQRAQVGPMAAVAGAIAQRVGQDLLEYSAEIIVENGGDTYLNCMEALTIGLFAGKSPLSNKVRLRIAPDKMPLGICTSSATVGPSLSFGKADAVCVLADSAAVADAAASAVGNRVSDKRDIEAAMAIGSGIPGVTGIVVILGDVLGAWGDVTLAD